MTKDLLARALVALALFTTPAAAQAGNPGASKPPLAQRIAHADPARYRTLEAVHGGAGSMAFGPLLGADALSTNLNFVHSGVIAPHSGIGQHFHMKCEEMFVILDGEAEFTIDGRTSRIVGPAAVPNLMGHAHAIYNPTDRPLQWMNINVGLSKSYDAFDLGDARVGAALDPIPQFISGRFDRALLRPFAREGTHGEVKMRRLFGPAVFATPWAYVDHFTLARGAATDRATVPDMSEVLVVLAGEGAVTVDGETASVRAGDVVAVDVGQSRALQSSSAVFELMVIGVARNLEAKAEYMRAIAAERGAGR